MIKNEKQLRSARAQLARLADALASLATKPDDGWLDLELRTVRSQITELEQQVADYEGLKTGAVAVGQVGSLDDLPRLLIRQRIANGLTQKDLAALLGMKEQQIQRYEADDWATASLKRLIEVADAVGLSVGKVAPAPWGDGPQLERTINRSLAKKGISAEFLDRRFRPAQSSDSGDLLDLTARLSRVYGWRPSDIAKGNLAEPELALAASFKMPKRTNESRTHAYTVYSQYLALLTLDATSSVTPVSLTTSSKEMRQRILEHHDEVSFEAVLDTAWRSGVPVLPLADPGAFHAVLWRAGRRNVVVLKQQNRTPSRWVFDLLHELRHGAEQPEAEVYGVIDDEETDAADKSERTANQFAGNILLQGRAERLAEEAAARAGGAVNMLTRVVAQVADDNDVSAADLANYIAYRLSSQGINWWGSAQRFQDVGNDPWRTARRRFLEECDLSKLAALDRDLLLQALEEAA
jgi:Zn-dependent peptidase ImmA (M78 family)/transcriptional regulator with XRE-family HTH domain